MIGDLNGLLTSGSWLDLSGWLLGRPLSWLAESRRVGVSRPLMANLESDWEMCSGGVAARGDPLIADRLDALSCEFNHNKSLFEVCYRGQVSDDPSPPWCCEGEWYRDDLLLHFPVTERLMISQLEPSFLYIKHRELDNPFMRRDRWIFNSHDMIHHPQARTSLISTMVL